jgi:ABC-type microcin C transport system duplicated ATPase subunit YejF
MSLLFQDPYSVSDPRQKIGNIVIEPLKVHRATSSPNREDATRSLLNMVGLDLSVRSRYPHELSGGQRQRVGIALALASELIIFDEPISALDASMQVQIINLLQKLHDQRKDLSYIFISHDLSILDI